MSEPGDLSTVPVGCPVLLLICQTNLSFSISKIVCVGKLSPCGMPAAPGISAAPSEENLRYFNVMILGPQASPYEGVSPHAVPWLHGYSRAACTRLCRGCTVIKGWQSPWVLCCAGGTFRLELFLPEDYPMAAPKVISWALLAVCFCQPGLQVLQTLLSVPLLRRSAS